jgi:hypothetical protein
MSRAKQNRSIDIVQWYASHAVRGRALTILTLTFSLKHREQHPLADAEAQHSAGAARGVGMMKKRPCERTGVD